ncbi:hypothetical protein [Nocardia bhagyanarayanae]|uniref:Uncharacterized protein n=1 Tax=Nocardia bhagyanarayanae TaxID=1215925 RepID=A0A543FG31_9NOCA|nr:hypothetical protein [Nocardia bhagyanarayanae]TQM32712.1 hypothetical protein FB390_4408 [Nocardia bhagyanarayanae]
MGGAAQASRRHRRPSRCEEGVPTNPTALLSSDHLQAAIAGHLDDQAGSPLIGWARELGDLHATLLTGWLNPARRPADFDEMVLRSRISEVIGEIDSWTVFVLPRAAAGARKHTHTLGEVISHVAKTYAEAWWTVLHTSEEQPELRHEAWFHLGQVHEAYADLVNDLYARRIELPLGWRGITGTPRT